MSAGIHIGLGDYARGEELANEARELARRIGFPPPFVSAGIDLLTVFARSHDPGRAEALLDDVAQAVVAASGWHGWLWRLRLSQARAELALARGEPQSAIAAATEAIADSKARSRPKYVALGTWRVQARRGKRSARCHRRSSTHRGIGRDRAHARRSGSAPESAERAESGLEGDRCARRGSSCVLQSDSGEPGRPSVARALFSAANWPRTNRCDIFDNLS